MPTSIQHRPRSIQPPIKAGRLDASPAALSARRPIKVQPQIDTVHFGAHAEAKSPSRGSWFYRTFIQPLIRFPSKVYRSIANLLDDCRAILQVFITIPAGFISLLPLPHSWWSRLQRYVFFRPIASSNLSSLKDKTLVPQITEHRLKLGEYQTTLKNAGFTFDPATDAVNIHGWHIKAKNNKPTVVFNHGLSTNISKLSKVIRLFSDRGYGVFVYDYPGFGQSGGEPDEKSCYKSGLAVTQYLANHLGIPTNQQVLVGYSMGSTVAADVARRLTDSLQSPPKALVLLNAFPSLRETFRYRMGIAYPWIKPLVREDKIILECTSTENLKRLPKLPILILHGKKDLDIPYPLVRSTMSTEAKALKGHNITFELMEKVRHRLWDDDYDTIGKHFFNYMDRRFPAGERP